MEDKTMIQEIYDFVKPELESNEIITRDIFSKVENIAIHEAGHVNAYYSYAQTVLLYKIYKLLAEKEGKIEKEDEPKKRGKKE